MSITAPKTAGRRTRKEYPPHLAAVEKFDEFFLAALGSFSKAVKTGELSNKVYDLTEDFDVARKARLWAASADWRGLVDSGDEPIGEQTFKLNEKGEKALAKLG